MEYDDLAAAYAAHRERDDPVLDAIRTGGRVTAQSRVLEVGCGTGNYAIALQRATGCVCHGVEPSREMLAVARSRSPSVSFAAGGAERLPFAEGGFDLVYSVDVVHHVADRAGAAAESYRVLRPGGRVCVATEDEQAIRARLLARYFPETVAADLARYPGPAALRADLEDAGFVGVREQRVRSAYHVEDAGPYRARAFSCLHLISDRCYRTGLARLEGDLAQGPVGGESVQLLVWARKPLAS